uniref:Helicase POLQ-like n=1 Tax=Ditylenchus dipsaci TaxID=166011 RepID=A0A915DZU1_9BILA
MADELNDSINLYSDVDLSFDPMITSTLDISTFSSAEKKMKFTPIKCPTKVLNESYGVNENSRPSPMASLNSCDFSNLNDISINSSLPLCQRSFFELLMDLELPHEIAEAYKSRKIETLYEWQDECLSDKRLLDGENFILSLPTSAGKTLVAEILMLRETLVLKRNCIMIVPFVAIVQELVLSLSKFEHNFDICVEEYARKKGRIPPIKRRNGQCSIYICTIEKANVLINSLIDPASRLSSNIGLVIVDELHMLGDGFRGAHLEMCLTKLLRKINPQIVGMSATLSNLPELQRFLGDAHVFTTEFRPIELKQLFKVGSSLCSVETEKEEVDLGSKRNPEDPDGIFLLLNPILNERSIIIFCSSKEYCQNTCRLITRNIHQKVKEENKERREQIIDELKREGDNRIDPILEKGILAGIAYHHSDLTAEERLHVEAAFKEGVIRVICSTSTLAAGVNLPCRRVIIRTPYVGRARLTKGKYLQMIGRAGRAGLDRRGESIVMLKEAERIWFMEMVKGPMEACNSSLEDAYLLEAFYLDLIALKVCQSIEDLGDTMLNSTLYGIQKKDDVFFQLNAILDRLREKEMITVKNSSQLLPTLKGSATFNANLNPSTALDVNDALTKNLDRGIVFFSCFHLIFIVIPLDVQLNFSARIRWDVFLEQLLALSEGEQALLKSMGITKSDIGRQVGKDYQPDKKSEKLRVYIALMLHQLWNEKTLWDVSKMFDVSRGWIQNMLQEIFIHAGAIMRFAEKIPSLWPLKILLPEFLRKLTSCSCQELVSLMAIDYVKQSRAQLLYNQGFKTVQSIAETEPGFLVKALNGHLNHYQAERIINSAQGIIRDRIAENEEELELLGVAI